ncbi:hypothetical protein HU200_006609 [Digitaria exilis]|uniref:C2 domain-containing protein n=1 Tax=Digitaria exilis TaxID=1010633 RepID=A0A835FPL3_9POAL|nr:hypothetical protein HU200_032236 [Digitaria exilis]KAF8769382.1 hypothetical protein HU200_006609 [Digitaria exilis]
MPSLAGDSRANAHRHNHNLSPVMAYPYIFRAQAPPVRVEDHKVVGNDAAPVPHGSRSGWLGGGVLGSGERLASAYDLVETMRYLYVRVVKARGLPVTGVCYVEARVGNRRGATRRFEGKVAKANPEWDQVFAFSRECVHATTLEVFVRDGEDAMAGSVAFDIAEAPVRVPPDSPLAPQWYRLEATGGGGGMVVTGGEVMLAVWVGTQADEAFPDAWHASDAGVAAAQSTRSKVYVTPKLWYLRISVLEAHDVMVPAGAAAIACRGRQHVEVFAKVQVGGMVLRTRPCRCAAAGARTPASFTWNEELVFTVAEPFDEPAVLIVEARVHPGNNKHEVIIIGRAVLPLALFEKRLDARRHVQPQWFSLEPFGRSPEPAAFFSFAAGGGGRVRLRACLEGAYHVMEEPAVYASDARPTARQLWRPPVAVLEVGVLAAQELTPMKTDAGDGRSATTDAYCVAKYGNKWVRTRTVTDSCSPKWNEQYTWEVYDPCTVLTLAVLHNAHLAGDKRDQRIGKIRIRLSTLEMDRVYTTAHPLLVLDPSSGLRKNGELRLALRLTCLSLAGVVRLYGKPFFPNMHYAHPFTAAQMETLRRQAMGVVAARLGRSEPPLRREVVEYMLDAGSHAWSIRRSKANFLRVTALLAGAAATARQLLAGAAAGGRLILPAVFLYMAGAGLWNYRRRPRRPANMDARLSCAGEGGITTDELDEEQDTFPTSRPSNAVVRVRYDRLRSVAGRIQAVVGDVATVGERVRSLLAWRDTRATAIFTAFCLAAAVVLYVTPMRAVALFAGLYVLRHPRFRSHMPSAAGNFFKRLPSRADTML